MKSIFLLTLIMAYALPGAAQTATISGLVLDETSKALPGIPVYCTELAPNAASPGPARTPPTAASAHTTTDALGSFALKNLQAGTYNLCAVAVSSGQVSSCEWGSRPYTVSVAAGSSSTGVQLIMGSGDVARVYVNDINGKVGAGARLSIGFIADNGRYGFAKMTGQTGTVLEYDLTIPKSRTSRLVVDTTLAVFDAQGAAIAAGKPGLVLAGPTEVAISVR